VTTLTDKVTPNNLNQMLDSCVSQHEKLDSAYWGYGPTWEGDCQAFVHCMWGLRTGGFSSAYNQWLGLDSEDRIVLTDLNKAPLGSTLFSKGSTPHGHTWPSARPFASGTPGSWSTDLPRTGHVGKIARTTPLVEWGHRPLGAGLSINGYALDLTGNKPPQPKQNKKYQRIERAIQNMGESTDSLIRVRHNLAGALDTAHRRKDQKDAEKIARQIHVIVDDIRAAREEIKRLETLYSNLRHA
jgi:hypothetical protein